MWNRIFYVLAILFASNLLGQTPGWVKERPKSNLYFIGIGSASKTSTDHRNRAKADALNNLASEISVSVSSELIDIMTEYSGFSEEYARSEIRLSTKDDLEGYEFFDDYDAKDDYWVYYRISKDYFKRYANNALNAYDSYLMSVEESDLAFSLTTLINCLEYIYRASGQEIIHQSSGKDLRIEIPRLIKLVVSNIEIKSSKESYEAYYGQEIKEAINLQTINRKNGEPISDLDLEVRFERGDGDFLSSSLQSDRKGQFKINVTQISSKEEQQLIRISLNLVKFKAQINKSSYLDNILKGIARSNGLGLVVKVSEYRKDRVAVLVVGEGLSPIVFSTLTPKFNVEFKNQTDFDIMDYRLAEDILDRQNYRIDPCTTAECKIEIGGKLGVDNLIFVKINYIANARLFSISTDLSDINSPRIPKSDIVDIKLKRNQNPDEVIINNVGRIVSSFWSSINPGAISIDSAIPNINVEIINQDYPSEMAENRTTPFDIELSPGTYTLNFNKIGYVSRSEQIIVNKADKRSVEIDLNKKTRFIAFTRSLLIPGSGQIYSSDQQNISRKKTGKIIRWSLLAGMAASGYTWYSYDQSKTEYLTAKDTYLNAATLEEINSNRNIAQKKNKLMLDNQILFHGSLALIGVIWMGNAVDALVNFPDYGFTLSLETKPTNDPYKNHSPQPTLTFSYKF